MRLAASPAKAILFDRTTLVFLIDDLEEEDMMLAGAGAPQTPASTLANATIARRAFRCEK